MPVKLFLRASNMQNLALSQNELRQFDLHSSNTELKIAIKRSLFAKNACANDAIY